MQRRERLTVSVEQATASRIRLCGRRYRGGASEYLERLVRQDELREATAAMARWYAAHPGYAEDSSAEQVAALNETA